MNLFEKSYYTARDRGDVFISSEEAGRVANKLKRYHGKGSVPTGDGRAYSVKGGVIEHNFSLGVVIKSPTEEGLEKIAERFEL